MLFTCPLMSISLYLATKAATGSFEMAYVAESYYGDELTLFMDDAGEGVYDVEVKKNGSEVVCRSKVMFTEK